MPARLELVVRNSDRILPMAPGQTLIAGRTAQCDLQLDDPSVSRRHCSISCTDGGVLQVKDLESANGTFVNERAVKEATARRRRSDPARRGDPRGPRSDRRCASAPDQTVFVDDSTIESVIQRRIEPSEFRLAASAEAGAVPELALLKRAQRHLSTLHRVSEPLSTGARHRAAVGRDAARDSRRARGRSGRDRAAARGLGRPASAEVLAARSQDAVDGAVRGEPDAGRRT